MEDASNTARPHRLRSAPEILILGVAVPVAVRRVTRMLGLAHLDPAPDGRGLLIPGCRSVHTFGMRFAIDVHFIDRDGDVIRSELAVKPRRMLYCRRACAVLELQSAPVSTAAR